MCSHVNPTRHANDVTLQVLERWRVQQRQRHVQLPAWLLRQSLRVAGRYTWNGHTSFLVWEKYSNNNNRFIKMIFNFTRERKFTNLCFYQELVLNQIFISKLLLP